MKLDRAQRCLLAALTIPLLLGSDLQAEPPVADPPGPSAAAGLTKRWLFVWRDLSEPREVDRVIERLPRAQAAGYNGLVLPQNVAPTRAAELRAAAREHGLDLVAIAMGGARDRNYVEGVPVEGALFVVRHGEATFRPDSPTQVLNGGFEDAAGDHFDGWTLQDDEGVTTFADREVAHGGGTSLRMEEVGRNQYRHCRVAQPLRLTPHRQYRISFWVRSNDLAPADPEVKVLTADSQRGIGFQTFRTEATQDWTHYDLVFNSLEHDQAMLYVGSWGGQHGTFWFDDLVIEEIGLVNVLRRPGCPVSVRSESGQVYEEGRDYEPVKDPQLHPWIAYHEAPAIRLRPDSRIAEGERLRVSYYHPLIVYEDRVTSCLSEPRIFADWRAEIKRADSLLHPAAFFMSHDELRVVNQCALCRSQQLTPGQLLAWNVRQAAGIIRDVRPGAEIWVWSDMFDPQHNAVDQYYAVNGSLRGSWEGLDPGIGIVNWHGGLAGRNCRFFADLGLRQILSGYYDSDEDGAGIATWLANTADVPGIVGAMYTTWEDRYGAMEAWATRAWGGRPVEGGP
ncbi:MAG: carbohydrate binding domain-containing protein [Gemmatimonadota bacterium]